MASLTWKIWVWASSRRWWRIGKPGVPQSMGLQSQTRLSDLTTIIPCWSSSLLCSSSFSTWVLNCDTFQNSVLGFLLTEKQANKSHPFLKVMSSILISLNYWKFNSQIYIKLRVSIWVVFHPSCCLPDIFTESQNPVPQVFTHFQYSTLK